MTERRFADCPFEHIGLITPERDDTGRIVEFLPQARYRDAATAQLHAYGAGPFCRFRIGHKRQEAGLYVLTVDEAPVYAGECVNLEDRWGANGYGGISPRNCYAGGQPTNCRVNAAILVEVKAGRRIDLWFSAFSGSRDERLAAETHLIQTLAPKWNRAKLGSVAPLQVANP